MSDVKGKALETIGQLKVDATDALWRTAGVQFTKMAREPIVALLARHISPDDDSMAGKIAHFLETPLGSSLLKALLAVGLGFTPDANGIPSRLGKELRVSAIADAGDVVADVIMGPLRGVITMYFQLQSDNLQQLMGSASLPSALNVEEKAKTPAR